MTKNFPKYIDKLIDYAIKNLKANNFKEDSIRSTSLTITMGDTGAIFQQGVIDEKGRHILDCWKIFKLAKMIQDEPVQIFSRMKIKIDIENGEISVKCSAPKRKKALNL